MVPVFFFHKITKAIFITSAETNKKNDVIGFGYVLHNHTNWSRVLPVHHRSTTNNLVTLLVYEKGQSFKPSKVILFTRLIRYGIYNL
jgi:hypothetical protein